MHVYCRHNTLSIKNEVRKNYMSDCLSIDVGYMLLLWVRGYYGSFSKKNLPCSGQGHLAFQGSHETLVFLIQCCVLSHLYSVSDAECHFVWLHFVGGDSGISALGML